ncbi:MAG: sensor histidine kinase [Clostridia bacterium]|nr:sensor histidine kinase [Clostridia bacterium]
MSQNSQRPKRRGLKWSIVALILGCWVLPVMLLLAVGGNYLLRTTERQSRSTILNSAGEAVQSTAARLESVVDTSVKASYLPALKTAWSQYEKDGNSVTLYESFTSFLAQQYKYDEKVLNAILLRTDGSGAFYYSSNVAYKGSTAGARKFVENMGEGVIERSKTLGTEIMVIAEENYCFLVRNLLDSNYEPYGVLVLEINSSVVFENMRTIPWSDSCTVWIDDTPLCVSGEQQAQKPVGNELSYTQQQASYTVEGGADSTHFSLRFFVQGSAAAIQEQLDGIRFVIIGSVFLLLPLLCSVLLFMNRNITRPVDALIGAAGKIEKGNFGVQVQSQDFTSREFGYLADSFNSMSDTLHNQFEHIYQEELALRDARIMALQSQINPHFLNNTLEIINWEARLSDDIKVCKMLEALSTMLNAAMDRKSRPLVHLSEELMYVDSYLYIIRERLGHRLSVEKDIHADVLDCYVPRLVLQPVLENAVEHGINPTQKGTIVIRAYADGDYVVLDVENDGVTTYDDLMKIKRLLSDEKADEAMGSTSLGIRNVNKRLKIIYGEESGLSITITEKGNTLSRIKIKNQKDAQ